MISLSKILKIVCRNHNQRAAYRQRYWQQGWQQSWTYNSIALSSNEPKTKWADEAVVIASSQSDTFGKNLPSRQQFLCVGGCPFLISSYATVVGYIWIPLKYENPAVGVFEVNRCSFSRGLANQTTPGATSQLCTKNVPQIVFHFLPNKGGWSAI